MQTFQNALTLNKTATLISDSNQNLRAGTNTMVREVIGRGDPLYELDERTLATAAPDLIVTQALCAVCAVSYDDVQAVAGRLPSQPDVISLDPKTLGEVLEDLARLAEATGVAERGEALRADLQARLDRVSGAVEGAPRPRVVTLEWLAPPYAGGHNENARGGTGTT